jgi:hypothetical protein
VTFRVRFEDGVQVQYHTLPEEAQDALRARVGELREKPPWDWDNVRLRPPWNNPNSLETVSAPEKASWGFVSTRTLNGWSSSTSCGEASRVRSTSEVVFQRADVLGRDSLAESHYRETGS